MVRDRSRLLAATVIGAVTLTLGPIAYAAVPAGAPPTPSNASSGTAAVKVTALKPSAGAAGAGDPYYPLYGNGGYNAQHYDLRVRYDPRTDVLAGRARIRARATKSLSRFNLDLVGLTVRRVSVNGRAAHWRRSADHELTVIPVRALRKGRTFRVTVTYDGKPRTFTDSTGSTYGFLSAPDGALAVGEPEVAAFWYPVNDHPKDKATYRITATVPKALQVVSNGLPSKTRVRGSWATTTWTVRHRMASYLAFLAIGKFDLHRWRTTAGLPVIDAVDPSIAAATRARIRASFAKQGDIIAAESRWFGRYPFEAAGGVVDNVDVGFALENQTRPTYAPGFWRGAATGDDYVVVHELAHQWFGDSVALKRWQDIWLNEGFATYAEWLWTEKTSGVTPQETFAADYRNIPASDAFWSVKPGAPGVANLFSGAVYERGAMTLQALRQAVGTADFFQILRSWARQHRDGHGTTAQFQALAERVSGKQLDGLFRTWLFTAGKPSPAKVGGSLLRHGSQAESPRERRAAASVRQWRVGLQHRLAIESRSRR